MKQLCVFFYLKTEKSNSDGLAPIYGRILYLDSKTTFSTGISINPADWTKTKYLTKTRNQEEDKMRRELNSFREKIMQSEEKLRILDYPISASILKDRLFPKKNTFEQVKPKQTLLQVFAEFVKEKRQLVDAIRRSNGLLTKFNTVQSHLENYLTEKLNRKDIAMDELKYGFIQGFYLYLISSTTTKKKICNNTSQKYIQALRGVIVYAIFAGNQTKH